MKVKICFLVFLSLVIGSCSSSNEDSSNTIPLTFEPDRVSVPIDSLFRQYRLIKLKTGAIMPVYSQVFAGEDFFVVADAYQSNQVHIFNSEGDSVALISNEVFDFPIGRIKGIDVSSDFKKIFVLTQGPNKIYTFNMKGELLNSYTLNFSSYSFRWLSDEVFVFDMSYESFFDESYQHLIQFDLSNNQFQGYLTTSENLRQISINSDKSLAKHSNDCYYIKPLEQTIYQFDLNQSPKEVYSVVSSRFPEKDDFFQNKEIGQLLIDCFTNEVPIFPKIFFSKDWLFLNYQVGSFGEGYSYSTFYNLNGLKAKGFSSIKFKDIEFLPQFVGITHDSRFIISLDTELLTSLPSDGIGAKEANRVHESLKKSLNPLLIIAEVRE